MINYVRTNRKRPNWIRKNLWQEMEAYWNTEPAKKKSATASSSRNSDRDGLGPHKHVGGPKSQAQIKRQMEEEEGREVSVAEVFIKTHTRKDGSYVDEKARQIGETYEEKLQSTQSQLDVSMASDCGSQAPELTTEEKNKIFLESTMVDERGNLYGLGRLSRELGKSKKPLLITSSSALLGLEEKVKEAETKMTKMADEHKQQLDTIVKYLKQRDPDLSSWFDQQGPAPPTQPEVGLNEPTDPAATTDSPSETTT